MRKIKLHTMACPTCSVRMYKYGLSGFLKMRIVSFLLFTIFFGLNVIFSKICVAEELSFEGKVITQINKIVINIYPMEIKKILVKIGQNVKKGERLLMYQLGIKEKRGLQHELANAGGVRDSEININTLENEYANLTQKRKMTVELMRDGLAPNAELKQDQRSIAIIKKRLDEARTTKKILTQDFSLRLRELEDYLGFLLKPGETLPEDLYLLAPISGTIIDIASQVREDGFLPAGAAAIRIAKLDPVQIQIQVFENEIKKLQLGQMVKVELGKDKDTSFQGRIVRISWAPLDERIAVPSFYNVYIDVDNPEQILKPGYKVLTHIDVE